MRPTALYVSLSSVFLLIKHEIVAIAICNYPKLPVLTFYNSGQECVTYAPL